MSYEFRARLQPFQALLRARTGTQRSLEDACVSRTILSPEERTEMPPVLIDPEDCARVTATQPQTTLEAEWTRIRGASVVHQPTIRHVFKDVLVTPFGFFVGGHGFERFGRMQLSDLPVARITRVAKGFYASSSICLQYFGHWLTDGLPLTLLALQDVALYLPHDPRWSHAPAYLDLLGISRIAEDYVLFEEMAYCIDIGQNENRRGRIRRLRDRLHASVQGHGNKRVYLQRGRGGVRRQIVNEAELVAALKADGFITVPVDAPLAELLAACCGARTVVSVEGSHMAHALFAAAEGALHVTLNPADRFNNVFADYMPALRSRLGTIVMERVGQDYRIDVPRTLEFLRRHAAPG